MKKKWGKPKTEGKDENNATYSWTKEKTSIYYTENYLQPERSNIYIGISNKNGALCGMKVGMKKSKAEKIMKKLGAEKYDSGMSASLVSNRIIINCEFKNGKVSSINCTAYVGEVSE